jgi:hypothetical protein
MLRILLQTDKGIADSDKAGTDPILAAALAGRAYRAPVFVLGPCDITADLGMI